MRDQRETSKSDIAAAYDDLYQSRGRLRDADALYRWTLDALHPRPGERLLDVASGEGTLIELAEKGGVDCVGVDLSGKACQIALQQTQGSRFLVGDGEKLPFKDQSFDIVTNLGSLEHFVEPEQGVREMYRILKPGARAAILLPNSYYLADVIWHVWRTGYSVSHSQPIERFATCGEWQELLEGGGLRVLRKYKYNFRLPRTRKDWRWYLQHPRKFIYLAVSPFIPFNLSYSFLFLCTRE